MTSTDGVARLDGARFIDERAAHPDASATALALAVGLSAAYAHNQHGFTQIACQPYADHYTQLSREVPVLRSTSLVQVASFLAWVGKNLSRLYAAIVVQVDGADQVELSSRLKINDGGSGDTGDTFTQSVDASGITRAECWLDIASASYADSDVLVVVEMSAARESTGEEVDVRLLHASLWVEAVTS